MAFINNSNDNDNEPSTPLLSNQPQHTLSMAIAYDDDKESCQKAAEDESQWTNSLFPPSFVLPALLFLQFGMAVPMSPEQDTTGLLWSTTNGNIVMFVITAALYRQTVQDSQMNTCLAPLLLPDILMAIVLGLLFCGQFVPALSLLLSSMMCMAVIVVVSSIHYLVVSNCRTSHEEEYDEESVHDEFGPGFEPLWTV
jgi:hypothetical protein